MTESARVEKTRVVFAEVTGMLEDAALIAAEGQAASDLAARRSCDRLLARLKSCIEQLQRLRRHLE